MRGNRRQVCCFQLTQTTIRSKSRNSAMSSLSLVEIRSPTTAFILYSLNPPARAFLLYSCTMLSEVSTARIETLGDASDAMAWIKHVVSWIIHAFSSTSTHLCRQYVHG